jgi:hypothetical protein
LSPAASARASPLAEKVAATNATKVTAIELFITGPSHGFVRVPIRPREQPVGWAISAHVWSVPKL